MKLLIRKAPFSRLTKEIAQDHISDCRYTGMALLAEQEATEARMIDMMADANEAALHAKRVTVKVRDIQFVNRLTGLGQSGPNNRITSSSIGGKEARTRNKKDKDKRNVNGEGTRSGNNKDKNKKNKDKKTK